MRISDFGLREIERKRGFAFWVAIWVFGVRFSDFGVRFSDFGVRFSDFGFGIDPGIPFAQPRPFAPPSERETDRERGFGFVASVFGFRFSVFGFRFSVSGFRVAISFSGLRALVFGFGCSNFGFRFSGCSFGIRISSFGFRNSVFGFWFSVFGLAFQIQLLASGFQFPDFGSRVQGIGVDPHTSWMERASGFRDSGSVFRIPDFRFRISDFGIDRVWEWQELQGSGIQFSGCDLGTGLQGTGFRVWD